ncbi:MAG: hypothetical protein R6U96_18885 [Promethearchaeia archaeon]
MEGVFSFTVTNFFFDSFILVLTVISGLLLIYGLAKLRGPLPEINQEIIARRRNRISRIQNEQPRTIQNTRTRSRASSRRSTPTGSSARTSRTSRTSRSRSRRKRKKKKKRRAPSRKTTKTTKTIKLGQLKPRTGNLSLDDFKCIHCFRLPELKKDKDRGIVVCPHCRFPSHADEFREWLRNSTLCSRCDTPLPKSYVRNPPIIPVDVYLKAMKKLLKRK